jgi:hypothetical protein
VNCVDKGWQRLKDAAVDGRTRNPDINCVVNYLRGKKIKSYEPGKSDLDPDVAYCRAGDTPIIEAAQ